MWLAGGCWCSSEEPNERATLGDSERLLNSNKFSVADGTRPLARKRRDWRFERIALVACDNGPMERPEVTDWATDWDYLMPRYREDAASVWAELRPRCPVARTERFGGATMVLNAADLKAVVYDPETFSSRRVTLFDEVPERLLVQPPIGLDPPEHMPHRKVLLPAFTPTAVARLTPATAAYCHELIDAFIEAGEADAAIDYARHIPVHVTAELLGFPVSDGDRFRTWVHEYVELGPTDSEAAARAGREMLAYFREQLASRRMEPRDDLTTLVAQAMIGAEPMPERTQALTLLTLLTGGIDTTWSAIGYALHHLATHPEDQARLRAEPELLDTAIEEILRYYSPAELARVANRDTDIAGCPVKAGESVWLSFPAANRDPAVFTEADRFVIDRQHNPHLAFGVGAHRCVGSNLARMELRVALQAWLERVPTFRLADNARIEWTIGGIILGPRRIPITF